MKDKSQTLKKYLQILGLAKDAYWRKKKPHFQNSKLSWIYNLTKNGKEVWINILLKNIYAWQISI